MSSRDAYIQAMGESVTNAIETRQMQQAEFVADIKKLLQEMKSGRHVRAKLRASRLMDPARRPFSFTGECETSVSREVRDDAILREVEVPVGGSKDVCEVVHIAGDADETSQALSWRTS